MEYGKYGFSCPICGRDAKDIIWELITNEKGEQINTPFFIYDDCIMMRRCKINVYSEDWFSWEEWNQCIKQKKI